MTTTEKQSCEPSVDRLLLEQEVEYFLYKLVMFEGEFASYLAARECVGDPNKDRINKKMNRLASEIKESLCLVDSTVTTIDI